MKGKKQRIRWHWRTPTFRIRGVDYYLELPIGAWQIIEAKTGKKIKRIKREGGDIGGDK